MMAKKCFVSGCMNEAGYSCRCSSPETLLCREHIAEHVDLSNRVHNLESLFMQPCEGTKEVILEFLAKENSKFSNFKRKITDFFSQRPPNSEKDLWDSISKVDCHLNDSFEKISQASKVLKSEKDPILGLLSLQPQEAIEKVKLMAIASRDEYNVAKLFYAFNQMLESLNRSIFTEICGAYLEKSNIQSTPEMHDKASKPTSIESANVNDSISLMRNENSECLKGPKKENKSIKKPSKNKKSLLNFQMSNVSDNLNKETESASDLIGTLRNKTAEILSRPNNPELELDFRTTCSAIQTDSYDPPLMQAYQDYFNAYQQKTSLYGIAKNYEDNNLNLIIYNTETETQEIKAFQTPNLLFSKTCITQLPNGKLFCIGNYAGSGIAVLIDVNGRVEVLPSEAPFYTSSSSIADQRCSSIVFNGNIVISGYENRNLWLYSVDIDSFSTIPYEFKNDIRKILINSERLYLVGCPNGLIHKSKVGNLWNWKFAGNWQMECNSIIDQVYSSYNKGGIYILILAQSSKEYFFCNLYPKKIVDVAYYDAHVSLRRVDKKIEAIKWNCQNSKLDSNFLDERNLKGNTLNYLGKNLEDIEQYDKEIKLNPNFRFNYWAKGLAFENLERYLEAIKCYDEWIELHPNDTKFYMHKGNAFNKLKRYLEAIECYDQAIKLKPNKADFYELKGDAFNKLKRYLEAIECYDKAIECYDKAGGNEIKYIVDAYNNKAKAFIELERYLEAIECYEKAIKLKPFNADHYYYKKGWSLNKLGRYQEALESYDEAIRCNWYSPKCYNGKGNTLYILERCQEAIECYDEAIRIQHYNPLYLCSRARVFNHLRQEEAALQDFNTAYNLKQVNGVFTKNKWKLSEEDINFINDALDRDRIELLQKMQV